MKRNLAARDKNDNALPIVSLDHDAGVMITSAASAQVESDVIDVEDDVAVMISADASVYLEISTAPAAAFGAGSIFLPAGMHYHTIVPRGCVVSAIGKDATSDANVFIVQLK